MNIQQIHNFQCSHQSLRCLQHLLGLVHVQDLLSLFGLSLSFVLIRGKPHSMAGCWSLHIRMCTEVIEFQSVQIAVCMALHLTMQQADGSSAYSMCSRRVFKNTRCVSGRCHLASVGKRRQHFALGGLLRNVIHRCQASSARPVKGDHGYA